MPSRRVAVSALYLSLAVALLGSTASVAHAQAPKLELKRGDHVTYIGNTLPDRMQHDGWLETLIQSRFPQQELTFRNLAFPGDELDNRPRSESFGSPDDWMTKLHTDVLFAFFGYNEAFKAQAGIPAFKQKLERFIDETAQKKYNGQSAPRLVLFSPIAHENLHSPHLPDGVQHNVDLKAYTEAMREVAADKQVTFVDLFTPTLAEYGQAKTPLTLNGVHLTPEGNKFLAGVIDRALFGDPISANAASQEKLREAVVDKDFHWWSRYRTVDGYNVFGGRSKLSWDGQSNADVMKREMEIFDAMTANRDKRVWAIAAGGDLVVDDKNTPPLVPVKSNIKGPNPDGTFNFLGGEEAITKMKIAQGMEVNVFASEEQFPDLIKPVQMQVDANGRLWCVTWPTYPHWNPKEPLQDKIIILPDDNGDGKADRLVVFADQLNSVTGFEFWGGGVIVAAAPELLFLKDTDGDDKADVKIRLLQGISAEDSHHTANSMLMTPDGWINYSHGVFHVDASETPTQTFRSQNTGVYRFNPRTYEVEYHFPIGPNPHGDVVDQWGYQFANDGTGGTGNYINIGHGVSAPKQWFKMRVRPVPATGILSSSHFPEENNGNFLICNSIGFLGVLQHKVKYEGADIIAEEVEPILVSSDPNFRPSDVKVGGDGALYVADWQNPIIGHMQHNIRDPNRDHIHGRIYRVTATGRPLLKPAKMKDAPIAEVLKQFYAKENNVRYRARIELTGRKPEEVAAATQAYADQIEPKTAADEQALLESLWVFEEQRIPNEKLLAKVFTAKEPKVRAAAIRTLGHWAGKFQNWEPLLLAAARDGEPLVRAEAVKAAVYFGGPGAAEAFFEVANRPGDVQIDAAVKYAAGKLNVNQIVSDSLKNGQKLSLAGQTYMLGNADVPTLLKMEKTEAVYQAILSRQNSPADALRESLAGLAKLRSVKPADLLVALITERDANSREDGVAILGDLLAAQPGAELKAERARLTKLATAGKTSAARQAGYAAWITADGNGDDAFVAASKSKESLREAMLAVAHVADAKTRDTLYARVQPLLFELPQGLAAEGAGGSGEAGLKVDYFVPNPANVALETLAALKPKASAIVGEVSLNVPVRKQDAGYALRFTSSLQIDTAGKYTFFLTSDDGSRLYIDGRQLIDHDGPHGPSEKRETVELSVGLHPIVVTYVNFTGDRALSLTYSGPNVKRGPLPLTKLWVGGGETLHDVAVTALQSLPGHESEKFLDLAKLIISGRSRSTAVAAVRKLPKSAWNKDQAQPIVDNLISYLSSLPASSRTTAGAVEMIALAKDLGALLPEQQSHAALQRLDNLDVPVIAIGTVFERMIYDKEKIAVQAGKPVEFRFSNTDAMPHNLAIIKPGSLEEVGTLAEATARDADAMQRNYVPKSDKILLASRLLQSKESQTLTFEAPKEPGVYPYVCTYPGHWRRMYGALYVVENLDDYTADPAAYLAAHPLPLQDDLLKLIGVSHEWTIDELLAEVKALPAGRSFEVGRTAFKTASCISCHRVDDTGPEIGPDIRTLTAEKLQLEAILRSVIAPSEKIDDKYRSYVFELTDGTVHTGMVLEETKDAVKVIENPLAKAAALVIKKEDIDSREQSKKSIMPEGVLSKLSREEILDLIAYIHAKGDKNHAIYKGGHEHQH